MGAGLVAADINHRYFLLAGSARAPPRRRAFASPCQEAVNNPASRADVRTRQEAIPGPSPTTIPFDGSTLARFSRTRYLHVGDGFQRKRPRFPLRDTHVSLLHFSCNARHRTHLYDIRLRKVRSERHRRFSDFLSLLLSPLSSVSFSAVNHGSTDRKSHPEFPQRDGERSSSLSFWSRHPAFRVSCETSRDLSVLAIVSAIIVPIARLPVVARMSNKRFPRIFAPTDPLIAVSISLPAFPLFSSSCFSSFLPFRP